MRWITKDLLKKLLPTAKFYNLSDNFASLGICAQSSNSTPDKIHILKKPNQDEGISESKFDELTDKSSICAIMCTDYEYFKHYNLPVIEVADIVDSLYVLAKFKRQFYKGTVIAVTGSSGKSTTTRICYDLLNDYGAEANLSRVNKVFGLSWNVINYDLNKRYWVNEVSQNRGMFQNARLMRPDVAVITNIAAVHLEHGRTTEDIAKIKSRIFMDMKEGAAAILYRHSEHFDILYKAAADKNLNIITFGQSEDSDIKVITDDFYGINVFGKIVEISKSPVPLHILLDMAAALGVLYALGFNVEVNSVVSVLKEFAPIKGRGVVLEGYLDGSRKITVVDESYNANPLSMKLTLEGFNMQYKDKANKLLILGGMAEGGTDTIKQHKGLADTILSVNPSKVILVGKNMSYLYDVIKSKCNCLHYANIDKLVNENFEYMQNDDYVFVKGSNSAGLGNIIKLLKNRFENNKRL